MPAEDPFARALVNDTTINVASLLQEDVGSTRAVHVQLDIFSLDDDLYANDLEADVRLTRLGHHLLADGTVRANVALECARCLTTFEQSIEAEVSEKYRQSHDVRSGIGIAAHDMDDKAPDENDDESFVIDEGHELDLGEAFRQNIVLALPMVPTCGDECPGPPEHAHEHDTEGDQQRGQFDVLSSLLDDDETDSAGSNE
jgi:uncharacterized protein